MSDPRSELLSPETPAERLAELAQQHPELGAEIAAHPNAYDGLREWIAQYTAPLAQPQHPAHTQAHTARPTHSPEAAHPQQPQPLGYEQPHPGAQQYGAAGDPRPDAHPQQLAPAQPFSPPQQFGPNPPAGYHATAYAAPTQQPHQPTAYGAPGATPYPAPPQGASGKRKTLIIVLSAAAVLLLAVGGGLWWFFGAKLGASATPEAAAKKLVSSITSMDPLALYGSFAPSEFKSFEPAGKSLLEVQTEEDAKNAEQFISDVKREVKVSTVAPIETSTTEIVENQVERVAFESGIIELDGDPARIAEVVMAFYIPMLELQYEQWGGELSEGEMTAMRENFEEELQNNLPYRLDFSELEITVVSVREGGGWYVSPLLTAADYAHLAAHSSDRVLGDEIASPAKNGANTPEAAAENLSRAIVDGDYDAVVEQLPLPERRLLSVYGESLFEASYTSIEEFEYAMSEVSLDESKFSSETNGDTARVSIENLSASWVDPYDGNEQYFSVTGSCAVFGGERKNYIDYYSSEYEQLWQQFLRSSSYDYDDFLRSRGYEEYEWRSYEDEGCLKDVPMFGELGSEEWRIIAVKEDGAWKISPIGTAASISTIISEKLNELSKKGELGSLFAA